MRKTLTALTLLATMLIAALAGSPARAAFVQIFAEDFTGDTSATDAFNPGSVVSDGGNNVLQIDGFARAINAFTVSPGVTTIALEWDQRWRSNGTATGYVGLDSNADDVPISAFGPDGGASGQWRFRSASNDNNFFNAGDFPASSAADRWDRFRVEYDFTAGTATVSWDDDRDASGFVSLGTFAMNQGLITAQDINDVTARGQNAGAGRFDNFAVFQFVAVVPAPAAMPAGLALIALAAMRRRR